MFKNFVQGFHLSVFITSALPAALLCLAVFWGLSTTHTFWRATESAIDGVRTIRHLHHALGDLQAIRSLRMQQLASPDPALAQQVQHLLQDFVLDFNDEYWPQPPASLGIDSHIRDVIAQASPLMAIDPTPHNAADLLQRHDQLLDLLLATVRTVTDSSTLILDPELDTYYLMDISVRQLPTISMAITRIQAHAMRLYNRPQITDAEQSFLRELVIEARTLVQATQHSLHMLAKSSPDLRQAMETSVASFSTHTARLSELCTQASCQREFRAQLQTLAENATSVRRHFDAVFHAGTDLLLERLSARRDRYRHGMVLTLGATLCAMLATLFVTFYYSRKLNLNYRELEQVSQTDPLTGIPNRRNLEASFLRAVGQARRTHSGFALGMIDIDFFKDYNDAHGHPQGDRVLQAVADVLRKSLQRGHDHYFRYGGEEFCFFTQVRDVRELEEICTRLRLGVAGLAIAHARNPTANIVTISLGATFVPDLDASCQMNALVHEADRMLYTAKHLGRNRVEISTLGQDSPA